jgi:TRAP-type C4-dicarboxylate transport system permease small subunit
MSSAKPSLLGRLVEGGTLAGGWALMLLSVLIAFEVLGRKFFGFSFRGVDEIGGYVLAVISAVGFSYALIAHGHVRIDLLLSRLPTRLQDFANWIAAIGMTAFAYVLLWQTVLLYSRTITLGARAGTPLDTPLIYPQGVWTVALALFGIVCTRTAWRLTRVCFLGSEDRDQFESLLEQEIEAEAADARRRVAAMAREKPPSPGARN